MSKKPKSHNPPTAPKNDPEYVCELSAAEQAAKAVTSFGFDVYTRTLLDEAVNNVARAKPNQALSDDANASITFRATLLNSTGCDLRAALELLAHDGVTDTTTREIYGLCFSVMKAAGFLANIHYRRAERGMIYQSQVSANPLGDQEQPPFDPDDIPVGDAGVHNGYFDKPVPRNPDSDVWETASPETVENALRDVHLYLQLVTEAYGWSPDNPMPLGYLPPDENGVFEPITHPIDLFDYLEDKWSKTKARRREEQRAALLRAAEYMKQTRVTTRA